MEALVEIHGKGFEDKDQVSKETRYLKSKVLVCLQQFTQAKTELKKLRKKDRQMVDEAYLECVIQVWSLSSFKVSRQL